MGQSRVSRGGWGPPAMLTWQNSSSSSSRRWGQGGGAGHMPVSGHPPTTLGWGRTARQGGPCGGFRSEQQGLRTDTHVRRPGWVCCGQRAGGFPRTTPLSLGSYGGGRSREEEDTPRSSSLPATGQGSGCALGGAAQGPGGPASPLGGAGFPVALPVAASPAAHTGPVRWWCFHPPVGSSSPRTQCLPLALAILPPILSPWERQRARLGRDASAIHHSG